MKAVVISLISNMAIGATLGFSPTAAVAYSNQKITTLDEVLDEEEISWLSKLSLDIKVPTCTLHTRRCTTK